MKSGGTRQAVLVAAALAASAVLAAWWFSVGEPDAPRGTRSAALVRSHAAVEAGRVSAGAPGDAPHIFVGADEPVTASPPASKADTRTELNDAKASPSSSASGTNTTDTGTIESPAPSDDEVASHDTKSDAGTSEGEAKAASDASGAGAAPGDAQRTFSPVSAKPSDVGESEASPPGSGIDPDKAADLMADYLASLDASDHDDSEDASASRYFDSRDSGGDRELQIEEALRKGIGDWIATLPTENAARLLLLGVECRAEQCRILIAQEHYGVGPGATKADTDLQIELIAQFNALSAEPWWQALGLHPGRSVSFPAPDGSGIGLWVQYEFIAPAEETSSATSVPAT